MDVDNRLAKISVISTVRYVLHVGTGSTGSMMTVVSMASEAFSFDEVRAITVILHPGPCGRGLRIGRNTTETHDNCGNSYSTDHDAMPRKLFLTEGSSGKAVHGCKIVGQPRNGQVK